MKKVKILYIDDEIINLQLFEIIFSDKYKVLIGESGEEGLEILDNHPDTTVIISDMKMPKMNGIEFIKKAKMKYPNKNYFILTGFEITSEIQNALDSKLIIEYFNKPFDINKIEKTIEEVIG